MVDGRTSRAHCLVLLASLAASTVGGSHGGHGGGGGADASPAPAPSAAGGGDGSSLQLKPWSFLSSKTPYWPQQLGGPLEDMPSHCRLVHVNHLGRHGSRHATKLKDASRVLAALQRADAEDGLTPRGRDALGWVEDYIAEEKAALGACGRGGARGRAACRVERWRVARPTTQTAARSLSPPLSPPPP